MKSEGSKLDKQYELYRLDKSDLDPDPIIQSGCCYLRVMIKKALYFIQTLASDSVIRERLLMREREGGSVSDGRLEILGRFASEFESLITLDTTTPEQNQLSNLFEHLVNINLESGYENG